MPSVSVNAASSAAGNAAPTAASGGMWSASQAGNVWPFAVRNGVSRVKYGSMSAVGHSSADGNGSRPVTRPWSAGAAARSWVQDASPSERVICERCATDAVQQVAGESCFLAGSDGSSTPRHCMITTGYSWLSPFSPYGLLARPPLGCAPFQRIRIRWRPRRFVVSSAVTVTVWLGNEYVDPSGWTN